MEQTKLEHYLKACVPLIYVRTSEDSRGVKHIMDAVNKANLTDCFVAEWTCNRGLVVNGERQSDKDTISKALNYLISSEDTGILIVHNIRQFISNFMVIQDLKDAAQICRVRGSYIILLGADIEFPPELKDLVTIYDFPLPDKEFFTGIFSEMVGKYKDSMELPETEEDRNILIANASNAALGMNAIQGESSLAISIVKTRTISLPVIYAEKEAAIRQSDVLELIQTNENLDTLGGFDQFKKWINKRVNGFSQEAKDYGLTPPKGVLIGGVCGTGKSLCAKVLASTLSVPLIHFDIAKAFRSLQGQTEMAVRQALRTAEAVSPCVLFIDEIEKAMAGSESSGKTDSGTTARIMQTVLTWLQEKKAPVFVVATMNRIASIPPELLRKGRFDEIFGVDLPVQEEREEIFSIHIRKRNRDIANYDLLKLGEKSTGYTGAEIEAAIDDAMATAFSDNIREFTTEDILNSITETIPQSESQREQISAIRDWITTRTRLVSSRKSPKWDIGAGKEILEETRKVRNK